MHAPTFSIITCTKNSSTTLRDTIQSVNVQSYRNYEHIFVDGNSEDGTLEIIQEMSPNAKVIEGVTGGISRAMNTGVAHASGEVIVHLHSDDFFLDADSLVTVVRAFAGTPYEWAIGNYEYQIDRDRRIPGSDVAPLTLHRLGLGNYIPHHSTFIKRTFFGKTTGFNESLRFCMDYELWFRLFALAPPLHIDRKLSVFRVHSGSVSSANRRAALSEELRVRMQHLRVSPQSLPRYLYRFVKRWFSNSYVS